jgi:hypothetical protein
VIGGKRRFRDLIERQLGLFEREHGDVIEEVEERLAAYKRAGREESEELYGDYLDAVETGTELLADIRDRYALTLEGSVADHYEREFNRAVAKRLPVFALEIDSR